MLLKINKERHTTSSAGHGVDDPISSKEEVVLCFLIRSQWPTQLSKAS